MPLPSAIRDRAESSPAFAPPQHGWLLADDLTGACDAGAAFLAAGWSARVWIEARAQFAAPEKIQAVNTASRDLDPEAAAGAVLDAAAAFTLDDRISLFDDRTLLFKKVDSRLRGPVAAELIAAERALGARAVLLAPAFPDQGRIVRGGVIDVEDASGQHDRIAIRVLFPTDMQDEIAHVARADELAAAFESGKRVLICDSAKQEDLDAVARAAQPLRGLLYAGSAGLARAIAGLYASGATPSTLPVSARTLLVCGTAHPVTELQLRMLQPGRDQRRPSVTELFRIRCESGDRARVQRAFASLAPQALVLTGGETALLALRALGVHSLILGGEFAPGIPWAIAQGGQAHGVTVATKSGGFGASSALNELLEALTTGK